MVIAKHGENSWMKSEVMRSLERQAINDGKFNPNPELLVDNAVSHIINKHDNENSSLYEKLIHLANSLRNKGFTKQADEIEEKLFIFKQAEVHLYRVHDEDAEDILDFAHPDGDVEVAESNSRMGKAWTPHGEHKVIVDIINKGPSLSAKAEYIKKKSQALTEIDEVLQENQKTLNNLLDGLKNYLTKIAAVQLREVRLNDQASKLDGIASNLNQQLTLDRSGYDAIIQKIDKAINAVKQIYSSLQKPPAYDVGAYTKYIALMSFPAQFEAAAVNAKTNITKLIPGQVGTETAVRDKPINVEKVGKAKEFVEWGINKLAELLKKAQSVGAEKTISDIAKQIDFARNLIKVLTYAINNKITLIELIRSLGKPIQSENDLVQWTRGWAQAVHRAILKAEGHPASDQYVSVPEVRISSRKDEIVRLSYKNDLESRKKIAADELTSSKILDELADDEDVSVRYNVAGNKSTLPKTLDKLAKDEDIGVRSNVVSNISTSPQTLDKFVNDEDVDVRRNLADNISLLPKTLNKLAKDEDIGVKWRVASNPSTPPNTLDELSSDDDIGTVRNVANNTSTSDKTLDNLADNEDNIVRQRVAKNISTSSSTLEKMINDEDLNVKDIISKRLKVINSSNKRHNIIKESQFNIEIAPLSQQEGTAQPSSSDDIPSGLYDETPAQQQVFVKPIPSAKPINYQNKDVKLMQQRIQVLAARLKQMDKQEAAQALSVVGTDDGFWGDKTNAALKSINELFGESLIVGKNFRKNSSKDLTEAANHNINIINNINLEPKERPEDKVLDMIPNQLSNETISPSIGGEFPIRMSDLSSPEMFYAFLIRSGIRPKTASVSNDNIIKKSQQANILTVRDVNQAVNWLYNRALQKESEARSPVEGSPDPELAQLAGQYRSAVINLANQWKNVVKSNKWALNSAVDPRVISSTQAVAPTGVGAEKPVSKPETDKGLDGWVRSLSGLPRESIASPPFTNSDGRTKPFIDINYLADTWTGKSYYDFLSSYVLDLNQWRAHPSRLWLSYAPEAVRSKVAKAKDKTRIISLWFGKVLENISRDINLIYSEWEKEYLERYQELMEIQRDLENSNDPRAGSIKSNIRGMQKVIRNNNRARDRWQNIITRKQDQLNTWLSSGG